MGVLQAKCDGCGAVLTGSEISKDYDEIYRCRLCRLENEIHELNDQLEDKKKWLEETHLKDVREMETKLEGLRKELAGMKDGTGCPRCEPNEKERCEVHGGCTKCEWTGVVTEGSITQPCSCLEGLR
jgi:hypothetical protein